MKQNNILEYLLEQEKQLGIKEVREACRKYMLKKTYAGCEKFKRKPIPKKWILEAWDRQKGVCPRCNETILCSDIVGDHIQPLALGGAHNKWNIQAMHKACNLSKGANDFVKESKLAQTGQTRVPVEDEI